ncbi:MAG: hypothetical protein ABIH41_04465 [Nanoarchaeota archaeon]
MRRHVNLTLTIISVIGFIYSTFYLLYYNVESAWLLSLFFVILFLESFIGHVRVQHDHKQTTELHAVGYQVVPLNSNFMLTSIIGILISLFMVLPANLPWGIAFTIIFVIMFLSSMISMTQAPISAEDGVEPFLEEIHLESLRIPSAKKK